MRLAMWPELRMTCSPTTWGTVCSAAPAAAFAQPRRRAATQRTVRRFSTVQVSPGLSWQAADGAGNTCDAVNAGRSQHPHAVAGPAGCVSASEALVEWCKVWSESIWAYSIVSAPVPERCAVLFAWAALVG
ncbi:hypothetical protein Vretimale_4791 [Volvox reticuliferus]|uniref:Uncharacterized protein n=1 Tax=Volvox reticuliferus TaxID=1737510 RepID=A0A8J4DHW6_9CHLO|nr:hypothetical protein Vretifemale_4214 [Volvox reticuliferus]GIL99816.1 hypothetical protein Vretimale_4791 [Volvox reticuliferus]